MNILKVNIFSLISTLCLIGSFSVKLIETSIERIWCVWKYALGMIALFLSISIIRWFIVTPASERSNTIGAFILAFVIFGVFIALFINFGSLIISIMMLAGVYIFELIKAVLSPIQNFTFNNFREFQFKAKRILEENKKPSKIQNFVVYVFYYISIIIYKCVVFISKYSVIVFSVLIILACALGIKEVYLSVNENGTLASFYNAYFEMSKVDLIATSILIITLIISIIIFSKELSEDLNDYGNIMYLSIEKPEQILNYINSKISDGNSNLNLNRSSNLDDDVKEYVTILENLFKELDNMALNIKKCIEIEPNKKLIYKYNEYLASLEKIESKIAKDGTLEFTKVVIKEIKDVQKLSTEINKIIIDILANSTNTAKNDNSFDFFSDCDSQEKVRKRYKDLCKVYHPDVSGDGETFKKINEQYEKLINN